MKKVFPEICWEVQNYLNLIDNLRWSTTSSNFQQLINRKKIKSRISAIVITHYMEYSFCQDTCLIRPHKFNHNLVKPINEPPNKSTLKDDISTFMSDDQRTCSWSLKVIGDELLKMYNIHTHSFWFRYQRSYRTAKLILSLDLWDTEPRIIENQRVCAVYRCRKLGRLRKKILESLTVKALVN